MCLCLSWCLCSGFVCVGVLVVFLFLFCSLCSGCVCVGVLVCVFVLVVCRCLSSCVGV